MTFNEYFIKNEEEMFLQRIVTLWKNHKKNSLLYVGSFLGKNISSLSNFNMI